MHVVYVQLCTNSCFYAVVCFSFIYVAIYISTTFLRILWGRTTTSFVGNVVTLDKTVPFYKKKSVKSYSYSEQKNPVKAN